MLDVHPPEHRIHGVRDFFLHLFTITIGLLIALGLEAGVETLHHRHQRNEADATIRHELQDNRADVLKSQAALRIEMKNVLALMNFLEARSKGQPGNADGVQFGFSVVPLQDAAWRTAASTGILSYMDYSRVEKYSAAYKLQDQYETMQQQAINGYIKLVSFAVSGQDVKNLSPDQVKASLPAARNTLADLRGMMDVSRGVIAADDEALK